jgi:hypothetical protein
MVAAQEEPKDQLIDYLMQRAIAQTNRLRSQIKHLPEHLVDDLIQEVQLRLWVTLKNQGLRDFPYGTNLKKIDMRAVNRVLWAWQKQCAMHLNCYYVRGLATKRRHQLGVAWHITTLRKRFSPDGIRKTESSAFHLSRFAIARKIKSVLSAAEWLQLKQCLRERKRPNQKRPTIGSQKCYRLIKKILTIL